MNYRSYKITSLLLACALLISGCDGVAVPILLTLLADPFKSDDDNGPPSYLDNCPYPITTEAHAREVAVHISKGIGSRIHGSFVDPGIANGSYQEETIECYPGTITFSGIISRSTQVCGLDCVQETYNSDLVLALNDCKTTYINPDAYPLLVTGVFRLSENITIQRQTGSLIEADGGYIISDNGTEITVRHQSYHCEVTNKAIQDTIYSLEMRESRINTGNPIYATYGNPEHVTISATNGDIAY